MRIKAIHMSGEYGHGHTSHEGHQSRHEKAKQGKNYDCPEATQPKPTTTTMVPEKPTTTTIVIEKPTTTTIKEETTTTAPKVTTTMQPEVTTTIEVPSTSTSTSTSSSTTEAPRSTTSLAPTSTSEQTTTTAEEVRLIPPIEIVRSTTTEALVGVPSELAMTGAETSVPLITGMGAVALGAALLLRQYANRVSGSK